MAGIIASPAPDSGHSIIPPNSGSDIGKFRPGQGEKPTRGVHAHAYFWYPVKRPPSVKISLPNPCQQDWDNMPRAGAGFHCADCKKTVVDFSRMTDAAIIAFLQRETLTCGVFREDQLDREITLPVVRKAPAGAKWLFSLLMFFGWVKESKGQQKGTVVHQVPDSGKSDLAVQHTTIKEAPVQQAGRIPAPRVLGGVPPVPISLIKDPAPASKSGKRIKKRR